MERRIATFHADLFGSLGKTLAQASGILAVCSKHATQPQSSTPGITLTEPPRRLQALLDMYTIQREMGHLENIRIGLVGDLANGRTARSLAFLLSMYKGVKMYFVAPDVVRMKDDIKSFFRSRVRSPSSLSNQTGLLIIFCHPCQ